MDILISSYSTSEEVKKENSLRHVGCWNGVVTFADKTSLPGIRRLLVAIWHSCLSPILACKGFHSAV